jgi:monofunctional biosynthetic peptidoglycan transglycosylase
LKQSRQSSRYRESRLQRNGSSSLLNRAIKTAGYAGMVLLVVSIIVVTALRFLPTPTSAFMLHTHIDDFVDRKGYRPIKQNWVNKAQISKHALVAVVASEDQRFYHHHGFDVEAIYKAYQQYQHGGKLRGASTISQQVAKNLFLSPARNFGRKALEIWFTFLIEALWSKTRILETYLNIAEFGDHLFGIEAASRHYFGISAKQLSASQAALLAATLPNPIMLNAAKPSAYLLKRQQWILGQMRNLSAS